MLFFLLLCWLRSCGVHVRVYWLGVLVDLRISPRLLNPVLPYTDSRLLLHVVCTCSVGGTYCITPALAEFSPNAKAISLSLIRLWMIPVDLLLCYAAAHQPEASPGDELLNSNFLVGLLHLQRGVEIQGHLNVTAAYGNLTPVCSSDDSCPLYIRFIGRQTTAIKRSAFSTRWPWQAP